MTFGLGLIVFSVVLIYAAAKDVTIAEALSGTIGTTGVAPFKSVAGATGAGSVPTGATGPAGATGPVVGPGTDKRGTATFEGKKVAAVAIPYLKFARAHGWSGSVTSGWRSPEYSRSLCINMCNAPKCPGRCAGESSNHVGTSPDRFAIDVSDYVTFGRIMARPDAPKPKIWNNLPSDRVHFSPSGG